MTSTLETMTATVLGIAVTLAGAAGCGEDKPAVAPTSSAPVVATSTTTLRPASPGRTGAAIYLSEEFKKQCGIDTIESTKEAPKFAFDEAEVSGEDRDVLARVAQCLTTGPLKGRSVHLIGRADKRGTQEYNMALGARRADTVKKYLGNLGVADSQMTETSRGELDATGAGEAGYRNDRRVDIDVR